MILMNTMPLGGPKRKIFAFEMSPGSQSQNLVSGGSGNPISEEVDMEILRGLEKPWSSVGLYGSIPGH